MQALIAALEALRHPKPDLFRSLLVLNDYVIPKLGALQPSEGSRAECFHRIREDHIVGNVAPAGYTDAPIGLTAPWLSSQRVVINITPQWNFDKR